MMSGLDLDAYTTLQVVPTAEHEVVNGAFKALAFKYHPDRDPSARAARKMAELNRAYATLRNEVTRAAYDRDRRRAGGRDLAALSTPARAGVGPPPARPVGGSVLTFGRYVGWGLRDVARHDPDYLLWLSRHSSGIRYRTEIYGILRTLGVSAA